MIDAVLLLPCCCSGCGVDTGQTVFREVLTSPTFVDRLKELSQDEKLALIEALGGRSALDAAARAAGVDVDALEAPVDEGTQCDLLDELLGIKVTKVVNAAVKGGGSAAAVAAALGAAAKSATGASGELRKAGGLPEADAADAGGDAHSVASSVSSAAPRRKPVRLGSACTHRWLPGNVTTCLRRRQVEVELPWSKYLQPPKRKLKQLKKM